MAKQNRIHRLPSEGKTVITNRGLEALIRHREGLTGAAPYPC
jgi:hypothetical protein